MRPGSAKRSVLTVASAITCLTCSTQEFGTAPDPPSQILWTAAGFGSGQPAADASTVYFGTIDHQVIAVNRATGVTRWRVSTGEPGARTLNGLNVLLVSDLVIFGDYDLYAFDRNSGTRRWVFDPGAPEIAGWAPGAYEESTDGTTIYCGSGSGHVYAVKAVDGTLQWATPLSVDGHTSVYDPVIDGTTLYVTVRHFTNPVTGAIYALNRADGKVLWVHDFVSQPPTGSGPLDKVIPYQNSVIVSNDDGKIYWLDAQSGQEMFSAPRRRDVLAYDDDRPIVRSGGVIVAASTSFFVTGYDAANGKQVWEFNGGQGASSQTMTADDGVVYVTYLNGTLAAIDAAQGTKRWMRSPPNGGQFGAYPLVADVIFAPSSSGLVAMRK